MKPCHVTGPILNRTDMRWHASCDCGWVAGSCSQREVVQQAVDAHLNPDTPRAA